MPSGSTGAISDLPTPVVQMPASPPITLWIAEMIARIAATSRPLS